MRQQDTLTQSQGTQESFLEVGVQKNLYGELSREVKGGQTRQKGWHLHSCQGEECHDTAGGCQHFHIFGAQSSLAGRPNVGAAGKIWV